MKLELYEARGNIDKISASLLANHEQLKKMTSVSPESEVYIDKLKDGEGKHTWKYVTNTIVPDESVAYVVVRSNKRQLMAISHDPAIVGQNDKYLIVWSQIALSIPEVAELTRDRDFIVTSSDINVQTKFYKTVAAFVEHFKGKRNWDIIVVKKDLTLKDKRTSREESRKGMEIKPSTRTLGPAAQKYYDYIEGLKKDLKKRLKVYSDSRLVDVTKPEELNTALERKQMITPKKIKLGGLIYIFDDSNMRTQDSGLTVINVKYNIELNDKITSRNSDKWKPFSRFVYTVKVNFNKTEITDLKFRSGSYNSDSTISFEEGLLKIKQFRESLENNQTNS